MQANAIQMPLKDESVQCCAFSPPYWGLRKYEDLPPLIWDGIEGCEHEWGDEAIATSGRNDSGEKRVGFHGQAKGYGGQRKVSQGQFCQLCNAWRGDLGLEPTPELYLNHMMLVMAEVWRVLRNDGVCFVNIGDSYSGGGRGNYGNGLSLGQGPKHTKGHDFKYGNIKPKSLCLIPQKLAIRCQEAGWIIRSEIIWAKPNPMPESCKDRPTRSHEQVWMMTKQGKYYWDQDAVREQTKPQIVKMPDGWDVELGAHGTIHRQGRSKGKPNNTEISSRNIRSVWTIATEPTPEAHFATWPSKLVNRMIRAATKPGDIILDPFGGTCKTVLEAERLNRTGIGLDLSYTYLSEIAKPRQDVPLQRVLM